MSEPLMSQITLFGCTFMPVGWAECDGQLMEISEFTALYSLVGTTYGGDGRVTFGVPDMRGRAPIGIGHGIGLTPRYQGFHGGWESVPLSIGHMPAHTHTATATAHSTGMLGGAPNVTASVKCNNTTNSTNEPAGKVWGKVGREKIYADDVSGQDEMHPGIVNVSVDMSPVSVDVQTAVDSVSVGMTGGNQLHENMPPFVGMRFGMAVTGLYPSRS